VFQWFPLHNLITVEHIFLKWRFDKQPLLCLTRQKQFGRYVVSSIIHLFEVITVTSLECMTYIAHHKV